MEIKSLTGELESESDVMSPFFDELVQLAENFDFDGIQGDMLELGSYIQLLAPAFPLVESFAALLY